MKSNRGSTFDLTTGYAEAHASLEYGKGKGAYFSAGVEATYKKVSAEVPLCKIGGYTVVVGGSAHLGSFSKGIEFGAAYKGSDGKSHLVHFGVSSSDIVGGSFFIDARK